MTASICTGVHTQIRVEERGRTATLLVASRAGEPCQYPGSERTGLPSGADDIKNIRALGAEEDVLEQLAASLAPSIFGHDDIKRALVLLLLGGRERNLENGTHLRGDINCLVS